MNYELYNDDCKNVLHNLVINNKKVDAIIADIPYNIGQADWDSNFNLESLLPDLYMILKDGGNIVIFNGWSNVCETKRLMDNYFTIRNWIVYDRIKGRGAKTNLVSTREDILWYSKGLKTPYTFHRTTSNTPKKTGGLGAKNGEKNRILSNVWSDISPLVPWSYERVNHPTQKPVQLMERCVNIWTEPNDLVLDFTMGSGSTGVACMNLGRNFIGIELNSEYYSIAEQRIKNANTYEVLHNERTNT